ncbi:MAG: response regulator [Aphanothece sp. CMT-3BRIN-NPC111]|jgi:twitching motility two-component system response regulator PilG|nr:response regulator [Aphanothece sp. CMT-3BRIN-NPC111]
MTHTSVKPPAMTSKSVSQPSIAPSTKTTASPAKALQEIVNRQISGRLTISDPNDNSLFWRVYVGNGQVHFATTAMRQKERLSYILRRLYPNFEHLQLGEAQSDYDFLCSSWQSGKLSLPQVRNLIFSLTQEALVQLLALPQAALQFERTVGLDPILLSAPFKQIILPVRRFINQWAQLRPEISSPFQRPSVTNLEQFSQVLWQKVESPEWIQLLSDSLMQNLCIYEVAYRLNMDALELATSLQPLVQAGAVTIAPYRLPQKDNRPVIACIDDSKTVQRNVQLTLKSSGYQVLELMEPGRALTTLARHKPALILMDISMPEIDGYELCRLLRQSTRLREVPIVMLTGRDGLVDRIRARMVGATDYMTKPFAPQQLLTLVQKLTSSSQLEVK